MESDDSNASLASNRSKKSNASSKSDGSSNQSNSRGRKNRSCTSSSSSSRSSNKGSRATSPVRILKPGPHTPSDKSDSHPGSPEDSPIGPQSPNDYRRRPHTPESPSEENKLISLSIQEDESGKSPESIKSPDWSHERREGLRSRSITPKKNKCPEPPMEQISDGEMESDNDDSKSSNEEICKKNADEEQKIGHDDLSDVSDLDSMGTEDEQQSRKSIQNEIDPKEEPKVNGNMTEKVSENGNGTLQKLPEEKTCNTEDGEEQLDFEAEEGECVDVQSNDKSNENVGANGDKKDEESLEEGEVSDEEERRVDERPKPVCRFFTRGACIWGMHCRFLHPGVTDKGNYTMFEVVRGPPGVPPLAPPPITTPITPAETAWERGLRTAKEMLRAANERRERELDFEEKKLHLSVGGAPPDPDADLAYAARGASPPHTRYERPPAPYERPYERPMPYERPPYERPPFERPLPYERPMPYERQLPYERAHPPYAPPRYEPEMPTHKARRSREVVVERVDRAERTERSERSERRSARGAETWADPWMRPDRRQRKTSYSSSSSSNSSSRSSEGSAEQRRRISSHHASRASPSAIVRERRLASARAAAMNPPAPRGGRRPTSPASKRAHAANPEPPPGEELAALRMKSRNVRQRKYSRSSSSGSSSSSSGSDSESGSGSSSSSSGRRRRQRQRINLKEALAAGINSKKEPVDIKSDRKRNLSPPDIRGANEPVKRSRREELLKQLKAVEDAIARKRSKV